MALDGPEIREAVGLGKRGLGGGSEDDRGPGKSWASSHPDAPKGSHERRNEGQRRARGEEDTGRLKETVGVEVKKGRWDKH